MPKVVVNSCWGGFGVSHKAYLRMLELGWDPDNDEQWDWKRDEPILVAVVEEMGVAANGNHAKLRIADVPDDAMWYIHDYDGRETVFEQHRSW